jgi:hypothetical protein
MLQSFPCMKQILICLQQKHGMCCSTYNTNNQHVPEVGDLETRRVGDLEIMNASTHNMWNILPMSTQETPYMLGTCWHTFYIQPSTWVSMSCPRGQWLDPTGMPRRHGKLGPSRRSMGSMARWRMLPSPSPSLWTAARAGGPYIAPRCPLPPQTLAPPHEREEALPSGEGHVATGTTRALPPSGDDRGAEVHKRAPWVTGSEASVQLEGAAWGALLSSRIFFFKCWSWSTCDFCM